jgi:penicillin-binding protein 1A
MDISIHEAERIERSGRRFVAVAVLAAIVVIASTWMGLFVFLGANSAQGTLLDLRDEWVPDVESMQLDLPDLGRLSTVYTADGVVLGQLTERNSQPVLLDEIPNLVIAAVLSAEDEDFMDHGGVDYRSVMRALLADLRGGETQGGSTITQQVVKQNFVGSEPTLERKVAEATIAIEMERRYTKEQILEFYLNSVFFGENAYGVAAAAQEYFGKSLDELTIAEAAALPVPIRNPSLDNLRNDSEIPLRARNAVIDNMVEEGWITEEEGEAAKEEPIGTVVHQEFQDLAPQVLIAARDTVLADPRYGLGATYLQRSRALFGCPAHDTECEGGGGLRIFTTVDFALQERAREILQDWLPPGSDLPTGAIAMVDNRTGATIVMASGLDFGTDLAAGQRQYDLATNGRRNPGSAFKPFGAIAALEQGIPLNSYWNLTDEDPIEFGGPEAWQCRNAPREDPGIRSLEEALYRSTNRVFCHVSLAVGPENIVEVAQRLGIRSSLSAVPAIVLGAKAVSPLEMASAYSTIANQGIRVDNYLIERIEDADGNIVYQHPVLEQQVLEPALAAALINTMEKVVSSGTGRNADIGRPQIGKTGTHENNTNAWFVGSIPQYSTAVWIGFPDEQAPMRCLTIKEFSCINVSGPNIPPRIWKEFMTHVIRGLPVEDFPEDPPGTGAYYATPRIGVPDVIGMELEEAEQAIYDSGLDFEVVLVNSDGPEDTVVATNPEPGTRISQGTTIEVEVSNGLSPTTGLPDLTGMTRAGAIAALEAHRNGSGIEFTWTFVEVDTGVEADHDIVITTDPPPGGLIDEDTVIEISIWRYDESLSGG